MKLFRSIKWRLLIWQTVLLAGVLVTLMTLHYQFHKRDLIAEVDAELQEALLIIMPTVAPPSNDTGPQRQPPRRAPGPDSMHPRQVQRPVEKAGTEFLSKLEQINIYVAINAPEGLRQHGMVPPSLAANLPAPVSRPTQRTQSGNRELLQPHHQVQIIIGRPLTDVYAELAATRLTLIVIGSTVLLIGFAIGWLMIGRALRPVRSISRTAKTIASGEHHQRIELSDAPEELASLAQTLNESFDHLDEAIETQKRFTADASHELRTPVAVVIAQTEAALKRDRSPEEYKRVLEACLRAGIRMKSMAESLLELTRLDSQGTALSKTDCNLSEIVSGAVDSGSLLSESHPVTFQTLETGSAERWVCIDRERIHQVVVNLISNAIQHNPDGCEISVSLKEPGIIEVKDNGVGIPSEHLPHIFERFCRVDESRSREQGGAGLGLAIVKRLVEAHGGQITVTSPPSLGATFTITLPTD